MIFLLLLFMQISSEKECIQLVREEKYVEAKNLFYSIKENNTDSYLFLSAFFEREGSKAILIYEKLFKKLKDEPLKKIVQRKLYEYYYSLGYYVKAGELKEKETSRLEKVELVKRSSEGKKLGVAKSDVRREEREEYFLIQCGLFSLESNARALKKKIEKVIKKNVTIKKINEQKKNIFYVFLGDFSSYDKANYTKKLLEEKLGVRGFIKKVEL